MNESKRLIKLSQIAKQKTIVFEYKNLNKSNDGIKKEWPIIRYENMDKQQQNMQQNKGNNQVKDRLQLSAGNGKELFAGVGMSTLMDISISTVKQKNSRISHILTEIKTQRQNQKRRKMTIQEQEIQQLKKRSKKILSQQFQFPNPNIYKPPQLPQPPSPSHKLVSELRLRIKHENIAKSILKIKVFLLKKIRKQVYLFDTLKYLHNKRQANMKRRVIMHWKMYVEEEGERRCMMQAIRERVRGRRQEQKLRKDVEKLLDIQLDN